MTSVSRLRKAYQNRRSAEDHLQAVLRQEFPQGARVEWERTGRVQHGQVTRHAYQDKLFVQNYRTRNEVKISAGDILRAAEMLEASK